MGAEGRSVAAEGKQGPIAWVQQLVAVLVPADPAVLPNSICPRISFALLAFQPVRACIASANSIASQFSTPLSLAQTIAPTNSLASQFCIPLPVEQFTGLVLKGFPIPPILTAYVLCTCI